MDYQQVTKAIASAKPYLDDEALEAVRRRCPGRGPRAAKHDWRMRQLRL